MSNEKRVGMFYVPKSAIGLNCETFDLFSKFVPTFAQVIEGEPDFWGTEEEDEIEYRGISPLFDAVKDVEQEGIPLYEVSFRGGIATFEKSKYQPIAFGIKPGQLTIQANTILAATISNVQVGGGGFGTIGPSIAQGGGPVVRRATGVP